MSSPVSIRSEGQARDNILAGQVNQVRKDLLCRLAGGEVIQDVRHCDRQPANARLSVPNFRVRRDDFPVIHNAGPRATKRLLSLGPGQ